MRVVVLLTEYGAVDRIIRHLELTFVAENPPPAYVFERQALMAAEEGGLSGAALSARSTEVTGRIAERLGGALPIIGVGGILSGADAKEKIDAGATLVQIYTGLQEAAG